jgi:hypothetical protein
MMLAAEPACKEAYTVFLGGFVDAENYAGLPLPWSAFETL